MQGKEVRNPQGAPKGKAEKTIQAERLGGLTPCRGGGLSEIDERPWEPFAKVTKAARR